MPETAAPRLPKLRLVADGERATEPTTDDPVLDVEDLPDHVVLPLVAEYLAEHGIDDTEPDRF